jgi:uncharacterized YccA/Bax inhibitor family protein
MTVLKSRRFWTFVVAQLVSIASYVFSHYVPAVSPDLVTLLIGTVEGVAVILISAYTVDDVSTNIALIHAGQAPKG